MLLAKAKNPKKSHSSLGNEVKQKLTMHGTIREDSTVNRDVTCLRNMFTKAVEWEMVEQSPFDRENAAYRGKQSEDEIDRLLNECYPPIRNIVECALNTGMRRGEILGLKWNQIRNGFIYLKETKTSNPRQIPINDTLNEMFKRIKSGQKPSKNVVGLDGKPVEVFNSNYVFGIKHKPYTYISQTHLTPE